jgi:pre-mRNA-splicing helicase BRR2
MAIQAMWVNQSPLLQLPFLTPEMIENLKEKGRVEDVVDFMNMDESLRQELVPLEPGQMSELAAVCNKYPSMDLKV